MSADRDLADRLTEAARSLPRGDLYDLLAAAGLDWHPAGRQARAISCPGFTPASPHRVRARERAEC